MSKKIKILLCISITFILAIMINSKVQAASAGISTNKTSMNLGDTATITTTINGASWSVSLTGAVNASYADVTEDTENTTKTYTCSFKPTAVGTYTVKLSGNVTGSTDRTATAVSGTTTITVKEKNANTDNSNTSTTKSSVATLSNLGIKPNDFSGFAAGKTSYSVTVPNDVESIELYATKGQSGQKITGTGNKTLKEGSNTFAIKVTAEDGKTTKTYTVNITRQASTDSTENKNETEENKVEEGALENTEKEEVFGLKELKIQGFELTPEFKTDIYEYSMKLIGDQDKLDLSVLATEENSNVEIIGNENLQEGDNLITITVVDESGEKAATYQITVNKSLVDKDAVAKEERNKKIIIIGSSVAAGIIIIVIIVIIIRRRKSDDYDDYDYSYENEIPFANLNSDLQDEKQEEQEDNNDDFEEEVKKKKRHSKGKRFK